MPFRKNTHWKSEYTSRDKIQENQKHMTKTCKECNSFLCNSPPDYIKFAVDICFRINIMNIKILDFYLFPETP